VRCLSNELDQRGSQFVFYAAAPFSNDDRTYGKPSLVVRSGSPTGTARTCSLASASKGF